MTERRRRIDIVSSPEFVDELADITLDELRERRALCDELDTELSYYRRLLHGRMDLLGFELRRRSGEEARSLIEALPEILAGSETAGAGSTGRAIPVEIPDVPSTGKRSVDRVLVDDFLAHLPTIDDDELETIQVDLTEAEREVSDQRRAVYEAYEKIQSELTNRYRQGIDNIDELLAGS
ncbi:MAG: hypothetical protein HKN01_04125 [Acidimicrobiia bacterium]|nr:hypothetical protein [Acidimicrobiia bacterium]NNK91707.1 hypothetical protein [Acidimicrobiia bacterium]